MLIKNAIVCDVEGEREVNLLVEDGVIIAMGNDLESDEVIDLKGSYLLPSLIDLNVRLKDAQLNSKNIKAIAKEAKKGGVGHIVLNADSTPAIDDEVVLEFAQNSIKAIDDITIDLMLNALKSDMTLSNIAILLKKGVIAPYMSTIAKNNLAIKIAEYVQMYGVTLFCKAEDNSLISSGVMLDGDVSSRLGLAGIPELSEVLHVSRMIEIAKYFDIKILFKSIASPRSVELIAKAKEEGVRVECEVSLHHLIVCDEACEEFNTTAKLNPPLASRQDMYALQEALKKGLIDTLTTLHQPNSPVNKEVAFFDAAYGCEALADALPLYYTKLVKSGLISFSELIKLTVLNPAVNIAKEAGKIEVGTQLSELVVFDPTKSYKIVNQQSLYRGEELFGEVRGI
jgi:dihydroorotase